MFWNRVALRYRFMIALGGWGLWIGTIYILASGVLWYWLESLSHQFRYAVEFVLNGALGLVFILLVLGLPALLACSMALIAEGILSRRVGPAER